MAEQTFRSPGFFEQEIELIAGAAGPVGTPVGVAGTSQMGPAFVPVTVASFDDFQSRFGGLNHEMPATYAANEWLKNRTSLTFVRTLGAGSNSTLTDISTTENEGTVKNAGFKIVGQAANVPAAQHASAAGSVVFLAAKHDVVPQSDYSMPVFTDNPSYDGSAATANLIRGMIFAASGTRIEVLDYDEPYSISSDQTIATIGSSGDMDRKFKIVISSSDPSFTYSGDGSAGVRILSASLDPADENYITRVLNTDPDLFSEKKHLLYADFPVDYEVAHVKDSTATVSVLTGSGTWLNKFGRFDTRYQAARTTSFISQPFGKFEYDLFHFECISDGESSNSMFKVSIQNIIASTDKSNPYGVFDVVVRKFDDDDLSPQILEYYHKLTLDPKSENYIARKIGDKKVTYNFDSDTVQEKRLLISGKFPNRSKLIRVVMSDRVDSGDIPKSALPFGFRGLPVIKTNESLCDFNSTMTFDGKTYSGVARIHTHGTDTNSLYRSILPPLPLRFKVTRGQVSLTPENIGAPGTNERVDPRIYWGVMLQSVPSEILDANSGISENKVVRGLTKFLGIVKQSVLVTGEEADAFNCNKFTLSRVALQYSNVSDVSGSPDVIMRGAAYVRNGVNDTTDYRVSYSSQSRVTLATLIHSSAVLFNRFTPYAKFTNVFYGGFDGLNILDRDNRKMNDRASSSETGANGNGKALGAVEAGLVSNAAGEGIENNIVSAYRTAADILTDEFSSNVNMVVVPGIRDSLVQDHLAERVRENSLMVHIRDIASYDDYGARLWDDSVVRPSVRSTAESFASLNIDNNYSAAYYPDVYIAEYSDSQRTKFMKVKVPSSVAVLGAIGYNDRVSYPWFAPAGFNRGSLDFVKGVTVRLNSADRDTLYDARVNPIATFPAGGYVIFGQKTLQLAKSSLDRLNVRRLVVEVKRAVASEASKLLFEQNNSTTRQKFVAAVTPKLGVIQSQAGVEKFKVIMDSTNNTQEDVDANRVNGKIIIVPTRTVEFIAIDFVITSSGVSFQ